MNDNPSLEEWRSLYEAACEFRKIECWKWMWDSDIFGVQNPEDGSIGYCCIMGRLGMHFGLAVYRGTEGLGGYLELSAGTFPLGSFDALLIQNCLLASFENKTILQKEDRRIVEELGFKIKGRHSWPLFRSCLPGYYPWYITRDEAQFLTVCLYQAIDVSLRFKKNPRLLLPPVQTCLLVRVPKKENGKTTWIDEWMEPEFPESPDVTVTFDEPSLKPLKKYRCPRTWEVDAFYSREPVREKKERPYYPLVIVWADHETGFIFAVELERQEEYESALVRKTLSLMERFKTLPAKILVRKDGVFPLLEPVTSVLGIELKEVRRLREIESFMGTMGEWIRP